ncbi:hypothetical protein ACTFTM_10005 [Micromonospora sp. RB23]
MAVLLVVGLAIGPRIGADQIGQSKTWEVGSPGGSVDSPSPTPSPAKTPDGAPGGAPLRGANPAPGVGTSPTPTTTVIDTVRIGAGPDGDLVTTTPQGALELLTRLLPKGKTSGQASLGSSGAGPGMPYVQIYLDRGDGPGMVRLSVYRDRVGGDPAPGTVELTEVPGNCVQDKMITVYHRGGLQIDVLISTCLAWSGKENSPAPAVLSVDEAVAIAANPTWGTSLPEEIVAMGAKKFPTLARSNG